MNKDLDKALKAKFLCQTKFTQDIENLVKDNDDLNYIDAIVHYCEQNKIEVELTSEELKKRKSKWIAPSLKASSGTLYKYAKLVSSASEGCVTDEI